MWWQEFLVFFLTFLSAYFLTGEEIINTRYKQLLHTLIFGTLKYLMIIGKRVVIEICS